MSPSLTSLASSYSRSAAALGSDQTFDHHDHNFSFELWSVRTITFEKMFSFLSQLLDNVMTVCPCTASTTNANFTKKLPNVSLPPQHGRPYTVLKQCHFDELSHEYR